jgi:glyceraldehyde-3-phosphate dehydrogenase (NADP+)
MDHPIRIAGTDFRTDAALKVHEPWTGQVCGTTYLADDSAYEAAVMAALAAQRPLAAMPAHRRAAAIGMVADVLHSRRHDLALTLSRECAKPLRYALAEVDRATQVFRIAAEECLRLPAEVLQLDRTPAGEGREGIVRHFPIGPVAGIAPFNYPLNLVAHKVAPALAAGCPMVLKPASATPLSALDLGRIIEEAGFPPGSLTVLPMSRSMGDRLVADDRFKLLLFTGSPEVGWALKAKAGRKKVVLELGGNAGVIISESADLERAVPRCLMGAFAYSGQVCIHAQRFFVHQVHYDCFVEAMSKGVAGLRIGDPTDLETEISVLIDEANTARVSRWIKDAVEAGARIVCGAEVKEGVLLPTILTHVPRLAQVCADEIFGPVMAIEPYTDFEDAIESVNDSRFGLQAGIFTDSLTEMDLAFARLEVGGVIVNDVPTFRVDHMPYGGVKDSGLGREGVRYAMADMLEPRILVKNRFYV